MERKTSSVKLLIAEDDDDDYLLTWEALKEAGFTGLAIRVKNGEELMDFLLRQGAYATAGKIPADIVILLDLNMPRMDGREALRKIKSNPALRKMPVIVLTNSAAEEDISAAYDMGVNSYINKPNSYNSLVEMAKSFRKYWQDVVQMPVEVPTTKV